MGQETLSTYTAIITATQELAGQMIRYVHLVCCTPAGNQSRHRFVSGDQIVQEGRSAESCSCIEGNPCVVAYHCRDWSNRFKVAATAAESRP